ncbi:hypothetical protein V5F53_14815 [Xanthobacter sp. V4C-4]|uniref:hypothetical protein n=1 Tax=Xanthobacter cornucopiae TaxID=3119924 RepID=UPI003726FC95
MSQPSDKSARLAAALRANLARRKDQARARRQPATPDAPPPTAARAPNDGARAGGIEEPSGEPAIVPDEKAR